MNVGRKGFDVTHEAAVRLLTPDDLDAFIDHLRRHDAESGTEGDLPHGPYSRDDPFDEPARRERASTTWMKSTDDPGWRRCWGLMTANGECVGTVTLTGMDLRTMMHRARLGIGIERAHRGRGHGRALMRASLDWAREQPNLDWIDLGVFRGNDLAQGMYERLGFTVLGSTPDIFRVDGVSIEDISMTLRVGARS